MKIKTGYKLFEMRDDGKLFPLFIGKKNETTMNEWVPAEIVMDHKGTILIKSVQWNYQVIKLS